MNGSTFFLRFSLCPLLLLSVVAGLLPTAAAGADAAPFRELRRQMVVQQLQGRGIADARVLQVMSEIPRHRFVPEPYRGNAYDDTALPIGHGQTISQPYMVAVMTELIKPRPRMRVLEVGTGSGYQAAVLSQLVERVYSIEIIPQLAAAARRLLTDLHYSNLHLKQGDGYFGWPEAAPFDAILVTAAAPTIPPPLLEQLAEGGLMVIPVGSPFLVQQLMLIEKRDGELISKSLMPVRFVPLRSGP
jgi:protein-L-isoaspartate(D-aspartate) O-methyltransferase